MKINDRITYEKLLKFSVEELSTQLMYLLYHLENTNTEVYDDVNSELIFQYKRKESAEERLYIINSLRKIEQYLISDYEDETGIVDNNIIREAHEYAVEVLNKHTHDSKLAKYNLLVRKTQRLLNVLDGYCDRSDYLKTYYSYEAYKDSYYSEKLDSESPLIFF